MTTLELIAFGFVGAVGMFVGYGMFIWFRACALEVDR